MNKLITQEQIGNVLNLIYQNTNISAKEFDAIKLFFAQLPSPEEKKPAVN